MGTMIPLIGGATPAPERPEGFAAIPEIGEVDLSGVVEQIAKVRDELSALFRSDESPGSFPLESVAVELGITAKGDVGLIVANGSVEVHGTITVTFARPQER